MTSLLAVVCTLASLVMGFAFLDKIGLIPSKNCFPVDGRAVVITGGSQGMGSAVAKQLAQKGANVVIVARNTDKLKQALEYILLAAAKPSQQRFHWISADLTKEQETQRVLDETTVWNNGNPPDIVWACAGGSRPSLFLDATVDQLRQQMDTNYWSVATLAQQTLKMFLQPNETAARSNMPRHIIMTSSAIAFVGLAGYAPYAPAKAAMRSLADCLRSEVNLYNGARKRNPATGPPTDISLHIILPGTILTPGFEQEELTKHPITRILEDGDPKQTEDEVARGAIKGLERGHYLITTQFLAYAMKASAMCGSPRDNVILDTVTSWITSILWLFLGPDMDRKVFKYGQEHGLREPAK